MNFDLIMLLYPAILAIHNIDEIRGYEKFSSAFHQRLDPRLKNRQVFGTAAWVVTSMAVFLAIANYLYPISTLQLIAESAIFALLINVVAHCAMSLATRSLVPGTATALFVVTPYSALALIAMRSDFIRGNGALFRYAGLGAVILAVATIVSLLVAYAIVALRRRRSK